MVKISIINRLKIVNMLLEGKSQRQISKSEKFSQPAVRKIWIKYQKTKSVLDLPKSGRPMKTTPREQRFLCMASKKSPFKCATEVASEVSLSQNCSINTVKRILHKYGLYGRIGAKKPFLSTKNKRSRVLWCRAYQRFNLTNWKQVIYSDECRFEIFGKAKYNVRRPKNTRYINRYTQKTMKYGGISLMVWGAIKSDGSRILIRCPERLNSHEYQSILANGLLKIYNPSDIFMQDGAPCHKSKSTVAYLDEMNVCHICDWPAQSPDLNIIENLWAIMKNKLRKRYMNNKEDMWKYIQEEWSSIDNGIITKLYESIPRRLRAVLMNKGHNIRY